MSPEARCSTCICPVAFEYPISVISWRTLLAVLWASQCMKSWKCGEEYVRMQIYLHRETALESGYWGDGVIQGSSLTRPRYPFYDRSHSLQEDSPVSLSLFGPHRKGKKLKGRVGNTMFPTAVRHTLVRAARPGSRLFSSTATRQADFAHVVSWRHASTSSAEHQIDQRIHAHR